MDELTSLYALAKDLAEGLGIIEALKSKLIKRPDPAADKLAIVLEELSKIYSSIDSELSRYLSIHFDPSEPPGATRAMLIEFEGNKVEARMKEARGHCSKICNIYIRYLNPWFHSILFPDETKKMAELFHDLRWYDTKMNYNIELLAKWLSKEASATLILVDSDRFDEANTRIRAAHLEVLESRKALAQAVCTLRDLQAEFIKASGAIDST
jgi:hypothetical protein